MATRARELLDRSRILLDRSRQAAAQYLANPQHRPLLAPRQPRPPLEPAAPAAGAPQEALVGICASIALRDLNLVDSLLSQLEDMEASEQDQDRLGELYRLDHLATRLRRNAENLRVLADRDSGATGTETASMVDVIRAGMSSIDRYQRVTIGRVVALGVVGFVADDLSRILAELLDNAANQSPPNAPVKVSAHLTEHGSVLIRIEDEGIGLPPDRLEKLNARLESDPVLDDDSVRHMGLAVVGRLAKRHGISTRLDRRQPHGTTATVLLPPGLVSELAEAHWSGSQTVVFPQTRPAQSSDPEPYRPPEPRPAPAETPAVREEAPLPRRRKPSPVPVVGGTTPSGLPRRVSRSIKNPSGIPDPPPPFAGDPMEEPDGESVFTDLGDFTEGERAAREEQEIGSTHGELTEPDEPVGDFGPTGAYRAHEHEGPK